MVAVPKSKQVLFFFYHSYPARANRVHKNKYNNVSGDQRGFRSIVVVHSQLVRPDGISVERCKRFRCDLHSGLLTHGPKPVRAAVDCVFNRFSQLSSRRPKSRSGHPNKLLLLLLLVSFAVH
jgi:hypothetical protein